MAGASTSADCSGSSSDEDASATSRQPFQSQGQRRGGDCGGGGGGGDRVNPPRSARRLLPSGIEEAPAAHKQSPTRSPPKNKTRPQTQSCDDETFGSAPAQNGGTESITSPRNTTRGGALSASRRPPRSPLRGRHDREGASSMVAAGAAAHTTEGDSRASTESGLLSLHSHGESIGGVVHRHNTGGEGQRRGIGMATSPSSRAACSSCAADVPSGIASTNSHAHRWAAADHSNDAASTYSVASTNSHAHRWAAADDSNDAASTYSVASTNSHAHRDSNDAASTYSVAERPADVASTFRANFSPKAGTSPARRGAKNLVGGSSVYGSLVGGSLVGGSLVGWSLVGGRDASVDAFDDAHAFDSLAASLCSLSRFRSSHAGRLDRSTNEEVYVCMHVYIYIYIYKCIHICICMHVCTYI